MFFPEYILVQTILDFLLAHKTMQEMRDVSPLIGVPESAHAKSRLLRLFSYQLSAAQ